MAHPGFPIELDTNWTWYNNVVFALVVTADGEAKDLVSGNTLTLNDVATVDDATYGWLLRASDNVSTPATMADPSAFQGLTAVSVLAWCAAGTAGDDGFVFEHGDNDDYLALERRSNNNLLAAVQTDSADYLEEDGASDADWANYWLRGLTWSASSQLLKTHQNTDHRGGTATAGTQVSFPSTNFRVCSISSNTWNVDVLCIIGLDVELSDAEWDTEAANDPFVAFTQGSSVINMSGDFSITASMDGSPANILDGGGSFSVAVSLDGSPTAILVAPADVTTSISMDGSPGVAFVGGVGDFSFAAAMDGSPRVYIHQGGGSVSVSVAMDGSPLRAFAGTFSFTTVMDGNPLYLAVPGDFSVTVSMSAATGILTTGYRTGTTDDGLRAGSATLSILPQISITSISDPIVCGTQIDISVGGADANDIISLGYVRIEGNDVEAHGGSLLAPDSSTVRIDSLPQSLWRWGEAVTVEIFDGTLSGFATVTYQEPAGWTYQDVSGYNYAAGQYNILDYPGNTQNTSVVDGDQMRWQTGIAANLTVDQDGLYTCDGGGTIGVEVWDNSTMSVDLDGQVEIVCLKEMAGTIQGGGAQESATEETVLTFVDDLSGRIRAGGADLMADLGFALNKVFMSGTIAAGGGELSGRLYQDPIYLTAESITLTPRLSGTVRLKPGREN